MTRVVLTREEGRNGSLREYLPTGAVVTEIPATRTEYREPGEFDQSLRTLDLSGEVTWIVVTSARAAPYARRALEILGSDVRVASVGEATTRELEGLGVEVALSGDAGAAALATHLGGTVLTIGARESHGELEELLGARDVVVRALACYETTSRELSAGERQTLRDADVVFVGAPSAWRVVGTFVNERALLVVPGDTTAHEVGGGRPIMVGWDETLADRLAAWVQSRESARERG